jgi:hypothetical protein
MSSIVGQPRRRRFPAFQTQLPSIPTSFSHDPQRSSKKSVLVFRRRSQQFNKHSAPRVWLDNCSVGSHIRNGIAMARQWHGDHKCMIRRCVFFRRLAHQIRRRRARRAASVAARRSGEGCLYCPFDRTARLMVPCETPNSRANCRWDFTVRRKACHCMNLECSARMTSTWASESARGRPVVLLPPDGGCVPTSPKEAGEEPPRGRSLPVPPVIRGVPSRRTTHTARRRR